MYKICLLHEFQAEKPEKAEFDGSFVTKSSIKKARLRQIT